MGTSPRHQGDAPEWADANCRAVLEAAPDAMLVVNRTGEIVAANQQATNLYGYSREHLIGRVAESLIPARLRDRHRQHRENFFANPEMPTMQAIEIVAVRSDASEIPVDVSLSLLTIGTETFAISAVRDATERRRLEELKRAEAVLREKNKSEERFRLAAQAGKMYAYEWDVATDLVVRSEEQVNVLGFSEPRQLTRQGLLARVHPEDRALFVASVDQLTPQYPTTQISYRLLRPDGSVVWLEKNARGFFGEQGKLLRVIGMVANITERKQAEEALRGSEERLRLAQQAAGMGAFERSVRTGVVTWSTDLEPMYGLQPGTFDGKTAAFFQNLIHPDDQARVMELVDRALKTSQPTTGEWRVLWPDGSMHWIAGRWQVFMDESGEPSRVHGVNMDVTERKRTEEVLSEVNRTLEAQAALLQSREELLKIFVKHVPAAVAMLDRDMRYLQVSDRWCADFSLDSSQMIGRSHYEIFPDLPERWKEIHRRGLAGETLRADEDRWHRGGDTIWSRWEIRPWLNVNGTPGGILIFSEDITHRKNAEEALLGMSRKLIEAHEQERTRIARDLHDDVVQRLALLSIGLEGVQQDVPDASAELRTRIGALRNQTTEIANDVQSLSHELHSSKLEYLGIVGAAKSFCQEFSELQKVEIDFQSHDLPTALPTELSLSLFRVLQEALRNATKHSGVKRFEVSLWGSTGEIHLTVSDLGAGFDAEAAMKSTGLGLTSMQERLRLVGGELSINSQPKGGTTIHARVPFDSSSDSARAAG
jgi:PAS domain S-box-containing protein